MVLQLVTGDKYIRDLKPLINQSVIRPYSMGSIILHQGEEPRSACVLVRGTVKVYAISAKGEEQILSFHAPGECFPSAWIFEKSPNTMFFYEALTDCDVALIERSKFIKYITKDIVTINEMLDYFTTNYAASLIQVVALEQQKARDKLIYMLYYLCQRYSKNISINKKTKIPLKLTHQNIASLVGLTRETAAMELNKLKKENIIAYKKQQYSVDISKLIDLINDEGFRNISISNQETDNTKKLDAISNYL